MNKGLQKIYIRRKRDALLAAIKDFKPYVDAGRTQTEVGQTQAKILGMALDAYELTGDHDHGRGPIAPGKECPGGDCLVTKARALLAQVPLATKVDVGTSATAKEDAVNIIGHEEMTLTQREAHRRVQAALDSIQAAQAKLDAACRELSAITHMQPMWKLVATLSDKVRAAWWRVNDTEERKRGKYDLDSLVADAFKAKAGAP